MPHLSYISPFFYLHSIVTNFWCSTQVAPGNLEECRHMSTCLSPCHHLLSDIFLRLYYIFIAFLSFLFTSHGAHLAFPRFLCFRYRDLVAGRLRQEATNLRAGADAKNYATTPPGVKSLPPVVIIENGLVFY